MSVVAGKQYARETLRDVRDSKRSNGTRSFRVLAVLVWAACTVPNMLLVLSVGRVWGEVAPYTPGTQALRYALVVTVLGWSVIIINRHAVELLSRPIGSVFLLAIAVFFPAGMNFLHSGGSLDELFTATVSLLLILAVFSLRLSIGDLSIVGVLGAATGAVSLGMALLAPQSAFVYERGGLTLAGPFNNSNYLGTVLVLSLPFALLIRKRLKRFAAFVLIALPILMGGSTTGIVTFGVFVLLGAAMLLVRSPAVRAVLLGVASGVTLIAVMALPLVVHDRRALTGRGAIWKHATDNMRDFIFFGAGDTWYDDNSWAVGFNINHGHHLLLDPLIVGGLPYFGLVLALLIMLLRHGVRVAGRGGGIAPAMYALTLVLAGGLGNFFILDLRDLRYLATGFVIVTLLSIASQNVDRGGTTRTAPINGSASS